MKFKKPNMYNCNNVKHKRNISHLVHSKLDDDEKIFIFDKTYFYKVTFNIRLSLNIHY